MENLSKIKEEKLFANLDDKQIEAFDNIIAICENRIDEVSVKYNNLAID